MCCVPRGRVSQLQKVRTARQEQEAERRAREREKMVRDGLEAAGATVVLGPDATSVAGLRGQKAVSFATAANGGRGESDDPGEAEVEDDEDEHPAFSGGACSGTVSYTAADERWTREHPDEVRISAFSNARRPHFPEAGSSWFARDRRVKIEPSTIR